MIKLVNLRGVTGIARIETYQGREHLVVPTVALMEGVIWPVNAKSAEFVPIEVLAAGTQAWNGHPVVMGHPMVDGAPVSANQPRILEAHGFGAIFNTSDTARVAETKKLELEAWLDLEAAVRVGADAQRVIERVQAGELVEVSVGAMVALKAQTGVYNGKAYTHVWTKITPDHLAMLRETDRGACSVAMGCGTNRVASAHMHVLTASGLEPEDMQEDQEMKQTMLQRLRSLVRITAAEEGMSDRELRQALDKALRAVEPGYNYVLEAFPTDNVVIYEARPEEDYITIRRSFSVAEDGAVTLNDDRELVEPVTEWKKIAAAGDPPADAPPQPKAASCGCGGNNTEPAGGSNDMDKTARINALIANDKSPFKAGDEAFLQACSDERLGEFEKAIPVETPAPVVTTPAATVATPAALASGEPELTAEQQEAKWLAAAPASVRDAMARDKARTVAEKTAYVNVLKGCTNGAYSEAELQAMDIPALQKMATALKVSTQPQSVGADYGLAGATRVASAGDEKRAPAPIDMNEKIRAARSAK